MKYDVVTRKELSLLKEDEIKERFYKDIEFGTGGIRGKVEAGCNRINYYTVARTTKGLCNLILKENKKRLVVIAYDTRNYSMEFAKLAARIFSSSGIAVKIFKEPTPTPVLSFAVREIRASFGIVITASHNPKEYNGYKVYGEDGAQIIKETANKIFNEIKILSFNEEIKIKDSNINIIDEEVLKKYRKKVTSLCINRELIKKHGHKLKVVYTPLHGTGIKNIRHISEKIGFTSFLVPEKQKEYNGDFPTVKYPNPEDTEVFDLAIALGRREGADILIATDPDCDRVGVMIRNGIREYEALNGNQIGILLLYYILTQFSHKMRLQNNMTVIKTIVTSDIANEICKDFNVHIEDVLTGFKYIGEKIEEYKLSGEKTFLFGFEESYGYLFGDFVRDKDGVIATIMICEMTAYYKMLNLSLLDVLDKIYSKYGWFEEKLISYTLEGLSGIKKIESVMNMCKSEEKLKSIGLNNFVITDYSNGIKGLPKENVISININKGKVTIRPSGTEPKIKFYVSCRGKDKVSSLKEIKEFQKIINKIMKNA